MADTFDELDAKDGYHVILTEDDLKSSLTCLAYSRGELFIPEGLSPDDAVHDILTYEKPTKIQRGSMVRLNLVLDAIARYLTTGGDWAELESAARQMRLRASGNLVFPGYHLVDSFSTNDGGTYQHIFAKDNDSGEAVLWEEPRYNASGGLVGGFIHRTTLDQIRQEQDNDGWREIEATIETDESSEATESHDPLQLRAVEDPGATEDNPHGDPD